MLMIIFHQNIYIIAHVNRNIQIFHLRRDLQNNIYTIENVKKKYSISGDILF